MVAWLILGGVACVVFRRQVCVHMDWLLYLGRVLVTGFIVYILIRVAFF